MGSQDILVPMDVEVSLFMTSTGELMASPVEDWEIEVEIASGKY
jgi:predicted membrane protein